LAYLESRTKEIENIHNIYNKNIPEYIKELIEVPELLRLNNIGEHCGVEYTKFNIFKYRYSRLDHSLGVALILDNFVKDKKQVISGLLHDMATPAFSHTIDYLNQDYINQESAEYHNFDAIIGSDILFEYFLKNEISINDVCDYSKYSLADNQRPRLCADRIEYLLEAAFFTNMCSKGEIEELYNDLIIVSNEEKNPEFCFETMELGKKFCRISIELGKKYNSYEAKISVQFISDLIKAMINRGEITKQDLFKYTDKVIMDMGINSSDKRISEGWKYLFKMDKVYTRFNPINNKYCKKVITKQRYVDPLIHTNQGIIRVSDYYKDTKRDIESYLDSDTDLFMYIDYIL
jgi:HD superfamily phosphohydrolase